MGEDIVDDDSERRQTRYHRLAICAADVLPEFLAEEVKGLLENQLVFKVQYSVKLT